MSGAVSAAPHHAFGVVAQGVFLGWVVIQRACGIWMLSWLGQVCVAGPERIHWGHCLLDMSAPAWAWRIMQLRMGQSSRLHAGEFTPGAPSRAATWCLPWHRGQYAWQFSWVTVQS